MFEKIFLSEESVLEFLKKNPDVVLVLRPNINNDAKETDTERSLFILAAHALKLVVEPDMKISSKIIQNNKRIKFSDRVEVFFFKEAKNKTSPLTFCARRFTAAVLDMRKSCKEFNLLQEAEPYIQNHLLPVLMMVWKTTLETLKSAPN